MRKLITLLLAMAGMVTTASATDYYAVGMLEFIGAQWDTSYEKAKMSTSDNENYSVTFSNVFLQSGWTYNYKVYGGGSYYPDGDDLTFNVGNSGFYDVTINFVKSTETVSNSLRWIADSGSALFLRCSMISGTNSSWNNDYPQYRFIDNAVTIDATNISTDIEFKFKWTDNGTWGGVDGGYTVSNGIASNVAWALNGNYGNIVIPQSTLKCDKYVISVNDDYNTFSVQGYEKVTTNGSGYCTYVNTNPLTISGATAYYATDKGNGSATAVAMTNPAAGTPMLIKGENSETYYFAVASTGTDNPGNSNAFKAGDGTAPGSGNDTDGYNYILNDDAFYLAYTYTVPTNKAYLHLTKAAAARALIFDDESTAINTVLNGKMTDQNCYNLSGQRVVSPAKGLYIRDGKKVIIK